MSEVTLHGKIRIFKEMAEESDPKAADYFKNNILKEQQTNGRSLQSAFLGTANTIANSYGGFLDIPLSLDRTLGRVRSEKVRDVLTSIALESHIS